jgi:hypothetical protein
LFIPAAISGYYPYAVLKTMVEADFKEEEITVSQTIGQATSALGSAVGLAFVLVGQWVCR